MEVKWLETMTTDHSLKDFTEKGDKEMGLYTVKEMGSREIVFYHGKLWICLKTEQFNKPPYIHHIDLRTVNILQYFICFWNVLKWL